MVRRQAAVDADRRDAGEGPLTVPRAAPFAFMHSRLSKAVCLLVLAATVMSAPNAAAQDARSLSSDMVGQWELSTAGRDKTCVVTLKNETSPQGLKLELEKGCGDALPFSKSIVAWSVKGLDIVRLQDAKGESIIDFTEVESGIFEGRREGEGIYLLQKQPFRSFEETMV